MDVVCGATDCQCRYSVFPGDPSDVSVKFALEVIRHRLSTLSSCKYNVNQATNVTVRHDLRCPFQLQPRP